MNSFDAIILGFIQGISEFLPISSSGHLIIFRQILDFHFSNELAFDAILQLSTTFALIIYFWRDLFSLVKNFIYPKSIEDKIKSKDTFLFILIGTIPIVILGLLFESKMESVFRNVKFVSLFLILGSFLIFFSEKFARGNSVLDIKKSFIIGIFQSLAIFPGFSRSGSSISGGFLTGISREESVRFSFLLSIPILFGTGLKKLFDIRDVLFSSFGFDLFLGSITAFIVGILSIHFLIKFLKTNSMNIFVIYRLLLAILILAIF